MRRLLGEFSGFVVLCGVKLHKDISLWEGKLIYASDFWAENNTSRCLEFFTRANVRLTSLKFAIFCFPWWNN